jgi:hypothetical protein
VLTSAIVLAAVLAGCGGGGQQQPSEPANDSAQRPPEGFQGERQEKGFRTPGAPANPPGYEKAKAEAGGGSGDT